MESQQAWRKKLALRFREGVSWSEGEGGPHLSIPPLPSLPLANLPAAVLGVFQRLRGEGGTERELAGELAAEEPWTVASFLFHLRRLESLQLLAFTVRDGREALASLHPISPWFEPGPAEVDTGRRYLLSRFAYQRRLGRDLVLESPRCHARLKLEDARAAALCLALARPSVLEELTAAVPGAAPETVETFLALLLAAGLVLPADEEGRTEEEQAPRLAPWSFHDLLFHA